MNQRQKIEERLRRKETEIQNLEAKLKAAKVYVGALRDVLGMMGRESRSQAVADTSVGTDRNPALREGSSVAQARAAILRQGVPMHIDELLPMLGKECTRVSRASLTGSLAAYVRRHEIFTRTAPNTYGLLELGHESSMAPGRAASPPEGFGEDEATAAMSVPGNGFTDENDDEIPF